MPGLGHTTQDLARLRTLWKSRLATGAPLAGASPGATGRLREVTAFGSNPGNLRMFVAAPDRLPESPALVLVLHGCTQTAAGYDAGSGWSALAERHGFVVVFAQQSAANNQNKCFNWFVPDDTARGQGEARSIAEMVDHAATEHGVDRTRIFVTGLSAGGAMAAVMLSTYPEVFAAGGIVAGLPYGAATNVQQAMRAMFEAPDHSAREWGNLVRNAAIDTRSWPRLSVWHGDADGVVKLANARHLVKQWTDLHGLDAEPDQRSVVDGHGREVWHDAQGREVVEAFTISGMGHGTPLDVEPGDDTSGQAGPYLLDVGISSSHHMARFWGLLEPVARSAVRPADDARTTGRDLAGAHVFDGDVLPPGDEPPRESGRARAGEGASETVNPIESVINGALRAAGLMR